MAIWIFNEVNLQPLFFYFIFFISIRLHTSSAKHAHLPLRNGKETTWVVVMFERTN